MRFLSHEKTHFNLQNATVVLPHCLLDHLSPDLLVDNHTHSPLGNIVHSSGLSVVELVWHSLVEGTITLDIHNVTNFIHFHVRGQMLRP